MANGNGLVSLNVMHKHKACPVLSNKQSWETGTNLCYLYHFLWFQLVRPAFDYVDDMQAANSLVLIAVLRRTTLLSRRV
jgi:hypothetical protein